MDFHQEEINKLLLNPSFRNWALRSNMIDFVEWEKVINSDKQMSVIAEQARKIILDIELTELDERPEDQESFERLLSKKDQLNQSTQPDTIGVKELNRSRYLTVGRVAAAIIFIAVFAGLLYFNSNYNSDDTTHHQVSMVEKHTQSGQQLTITLPDGSKVKLNSNSSISYPQEFFHDRTLSLNGEAFFEVVRDESNPFVVNTDQFQTKVLGTSFNVNAYEGKIGKVSVAEGKVSVLTTAQNKIMDEAIIEKEQAIEIAEFELRESAYNEEEILWKDGILVFSNENIQSIADKIERWFNVKVVIINKSTIGGDFSGKYSNESLEEILNGMGYALNFSFQMKGSEIIINGKTK